MDWENHLEKNPIQKIEKTVKIRVKLPRVNKKTTTEKPNFCPNTVCSLYFKIRAKKFHAAKPLAFSLSKKDRPKIFVFSLKADLLYFD